LAGAAEDYWHATVAAYKKEIATVEDMVKQGALKEIMLDEACRKQYADGAHKIWDDLAKQDEASAKAVQLIKEWRGVK
jgi:hypothetical protein